MKKRNLKNLTLNKISVSNLTGGADSVDTGTFTGPTDTVLNSDFIGCWSDGNSCYSEVPTGCGPTIAQETCAETCGFECESIHNPF